MQLSGYDADEDRRRNQKVGLSDYIEILSKLAHTPKRGGREYVSEKGESKAASALNHFGVARLLVDNLDDFARARIDDHGPAVNDDIFVLNIGDLVQLEECLEITSPLNGLRPHFVPER
jgi:hypothetical protein